MIYSINFSEEVVEDLEEVLEVDNTFNLTLEALGEVHSEIHLAKDFNKDIINNLEKKFQTYFKIQVITITTYYNTYFYIDVIKLNLGSVFNFYRR
jgi:formylmethanofuran dehydrogenase subunit B